MKKGNGTDGSTADEDAEAVGQDAEAGGQTVLRRELHVEAGGQEDAGAEVGGGQWDDEVVAGSAESLEAIESRQDERVAAEDHGREDEDEEDGQGDRVRRGVQRLRDRIISNQLWYDYKRSVYHAERFFNLDSDTNMI